MSWVKQESPIAGLEHYSQKWFTESTQYDVKDEQNFDLTCETMTRGEDSQPALALGGTVKEEIQIKQEPLDNFGDHLSSEVKTEWSQDTSIGLILQNHNNKSVVADRNINFGTTTENSTSEKPEKADINQHIQFLRNIIEDEPPLPSISGDIDKQPDVNSHTVIEPKPVRNLWQSNTKHKNKKDSATRKKTKKLQNATKSQGETNDKTDKTSVNLTATEQHICLPAIPKTADGTKKQHMCLMCGKMWSSRQSLRIHTRTHTGEQPFSCDICNRSFSHQSSLKRHKLVHTGEKQHMCKCCGQLFACSSSLNVHMVLHSGERKHVCGVCRKSFPRSNDLKEHMRRHTGEKYVCDICGKEFLQKSRLTEHQSSHTGIKPFKCDGCGGFFAHIRTLKKHQYCCTDNGLVLKKHGCPFCSKKFSSAVDLKRHTSVHTGVKPFVCDTCGAAFVRDGCLKRHTRRHTGEKPYSCQFCECSFSQSTHLKTHIAHKHME